MRLPMGVAQCQEHEADQEEERNRLVHGGYPADCNRAERHWDHIGPGHGLEQTSGLPQLISCPLLHCRS